MAKTARKLGAAVIATMVLGAARPVEAEESTRTIAVQVHDLYGVTTQALHQAQQQAARIYAAIGVSLVWVHNGADAPQMPANILPLTVVLLSPILTVDFLERRNLPEVVLGVAPHDTGRVYIFCGRIDQRARKTGEAFETILGRVLAHEIGHHLLPAKGHSDTGIMRAWLNYRSQEPPGFTDAQGNSIRTLLMAAQ